MATISFSFLTFDQKPKKGQRFFFLTATGQLKLFVKVFYTFILYFDFDDVKQVLTTNL